MEVVKTATAVHLENVEWSRNMGKSEYVTLLNTAAAKMAERMQRESDRISGSLFGRGETDWRDSMWFNRADENAIIAAFDRATAMPPSVVSVALEEYVPAASAAGPSEEYLAKLKAIGATALLAKVDADQECARFIDAVKMRGLRFYSKENVERYLVTEASKAGVAIRYGVEWTPLASYTQAIPSPVIETILWVKEEFPSATFSISEVKRYPDPFLMVTLRGNEYIIEKWDEPAYREE